MGETETGWYRTESGVILEMDHPLPDGIAHRVRTGEIARVADAQGRPWIPPGTPDAPPSADQLEIARLRGFLAVYGIDPDDTAAPTMPARNASQELWAAYAVAKGMDPIEATQLTRNELVARYTAEA